MGAGLGSFGGAIGVGFWFRCFGLWIVLIVVFSFNCVGGVLDLWDDCLLGVSGRCLWVVVVSDLVGLWSLCADGLVWCTSVLIVVVVVSWLYVLV